jgi:hypothetical protein
MSTGPNVIGPSRIKQESALQSMIAGLTKYEQQLPSIVIAGKTYATTDIITILQTRLNALKTSDAAHSTWRNAVQQDHAQRTGTAGLLSGARQAVQVAFSGQIDTLSAFGLVGRKKAVVAPETRVAAAKKAQATRAARHTMGKNQKSAIKGDVTGVTVTPVTTPPTPAPSPAPAPAPSPAPAPAHANGGGASGTVATA